MVPYESFPYGHMDILSMRRLMDKIFKKKFNKIIFSESPLDML